MSVTNTDYSRGNGTDTLTVSANSPLFDLIDYMVETPGDNLVLLESLAQYRGIIEHEIGDQVTHARRAGYSWELIGASLGLSEREVQQRYATRA
jgi:hypothetical protein